MAASLWAGERCMYRCVVVRSWCPANSWMAFTVAPCIARCEQKVCPEGCGRPPSSPALPGAAPSASTCGPPRSSAMRHPRSKGREVRRGAGGPGAPPRAAPSTGVDGSARPSARSRARSMSSLHVDRPSAQVHVGPLQGDDLAPPQAGVASEEHEQLDAGIDGCSASGAHSAAVKWCVWSSCVAVMSPRLRPLAHGSMPAGARRCFEPGVARAQR